MALCCAATVGHPRIAAKAGILSGNAGECYPAASGPSTGAGPLAALRQIWHSQHAQLCSRRRGDSVVRLNERAESLVQAFLGQREVHGIRVHDDGVNVPVVDCGVNAPGGIEAGLAMARIAAAGLAEFDLQPGQVQIWAGPHVAVRTDQPVAACLAAQYAGWKVQYENYFAMASGPMRAAYGDEAIYDRIGFRESPSLAVGLLESAELPPPFLCQSLAGPLRGRTSATDAACRQDLESGGDDSGRGSLARNSVAQVVRSRLRSPNARFGMGHRPVAAGSRATT